MLDSSTPQVMQLNLTQKYVFKSPIPFKEKGAEKTVNSKLTFRFNGQGLIEEHLEKWDHESNQTSSGGFLEGFRKAGRSSMPRWSRRQCQVTRTRSKETL